MTLLVCLGLVAGVRPVGALEFPAPVSVTVSGDALCALPVPGEEGIRQKLIVGTDAGYLNLVQTGTAETRLSLAGFQRVEGEVVDLTPWEGLPAGEVGVVAATRNPDRVLFLAYRSGSNPYLLEIGAVDLEEDPGTCVFLGTPGDEPGELAVSLPGIDQIAVLREEGSAWTIHQILATGDEPHSLSWVDLEGDGVRELVSIDRGALSRSLKIFARGPDQLYQAGDPIEVGGTPVQADSLDLEGDGRRELVVAVPDLRQLVILEVDGGRLVIRERVPMDQAVDRVHHFQMADGNPALFTTDRQRGLVEIHRRDGSAWAGSEVFHPAVRPIGCLHCDFNGDGIGDLVSLGENSASVTVMFGRPELGYFGYPAILFSGLPGYTALADFDGDGRQDLAAAGPGQTYLDFFAGTQDGGLAFLPSTTQLAFLGGDIAPVQLDADPESELVILDLIGLGLHFFDYGPGRFEATGTVELEFVPKQLVVADVDDDGWQDLLVSAGSSDEIQILYGEGDGVFSEVVPWSFGDDLSRFLALDLNGDRWLELVATDGVSRVWTVENLDGRSFGEIEWLNADAGASLLAAGDLDGDGDKDVVVGNLDAATLTIMENGGAGSLIRRIGSHVLPSKPSSLQCSDLDHDGIPEILVHMQEAGKLGVIYSYGFWQFTIPLEVEVEGEVSGLDATDLNGDHVPDLLARESSLGIGFMLLNEELVLLAVDPAALTVACDGPTLNARVVPDRVGDWELEYLAPERSFLLVAGGSALVGSLVREGDSWRYAVSRAELEAADAGWEFGAEGILELTLGTGPAAESLAVPLPGPCDAPGPGDVPVRVQWASRPWPNPFNPVVRARFEVAAAGRVQIEVYDPAGRRLTVLKDAVLEPGLHDLIWDGTSAGRPVGAGLYLLSVRSPNSVLSAKILLLK